MSLEWRGVAAAVATAPACAALRAAPPPKPRTIDDPVGGDGEDGALAEDDNALKVNVLMRLRDAGCAALPVAGAQAALVEDLEKLRAIAMKAANAAGESLMRRALVEVSQCGGYSTGGTCALACGFGMLSLSGSLPKHAQPLDWASAGVRGVVRRVRPAADAAGQRRRGRDGRHPADAEGSDRRGV